MRPRDPKLRLLDWVDEQYQLDSRTKYILDKFARFADLNARGWAQVADLAERTNSSERTVQYALRRLEADGLIKRTADEHVIDPTARHPRKVPVYQFAPGVEGIDPAAKISGARLAPEMRLGCKAEQFGAQTVAPLNEPRGTNSPSDEGETRAPEREALFARLEAAYPKRGLGFTNRVRARSAFLELLDHGVDAEMLILAAAGFAADRTAKRTDQGLEYWLADGKYRGWWPEPQLALEVGASRSIAAPPAGMVAAPDQSLWDQAMSEMTVHMGETEFGAYLRPAFLGEHEGSLYVVTLTATARQRIAERRWRQVQAAWANADPRRRPLQLVSKGQFEALSRQFEGVK